MSRRDNYLITVLTVALIIVILPSSLTARTVAAVLLGLGITLFLIKTRTNHLVAEQTSDAGGDSAAGGSSQESFALGKLFEATMTGMREGLLVVDKDMKVVASNSAAHSLFNLSRGKLDGQRLTELTRNPAIYSAFLDALKGTERSGVKVETHGPERLVFDLRTVPLASANGKGAEGAPGALG